MLLYIYPSTSGVRALAESTALIANGKAPKIEQSEVGATYDPILTKKENQIVSITYYYWATEITI